MLSRPMPDTKSRPLKMITDNWSRNVVQELKRDRDQWDCGRGPESKEHDEPFEVGSNFVSAQKVGHKIAKLDLINLSRNNFVSQQLNHYRKTQMSGSAMTAQRFRGRDPERSPLFMRSQSLRERLKLAMKNKKNREKIVVIEGTISSRIHVTDESVSQTSSQGAYHLMRR